MSYRRLWIGLACVVIGSFLVLGYFGYDLYRQKPPVPQQVVTSDGVVVFSGQEIKDGQNVWQSMGGQEVGSVWGHGAYVAPDWSADWLHREAVWILDKWATAEFGKPYDQATAEQKAALRARLQTELRTNTYDPATGELVISDVRAEAILAVTGHYDSVFGDDPSAEMKWRRDAYAVPINSVPDADRRKAMAAFFFWTSWACVT